MRKWGLSQLSLGHLGARRLPLFSNLGRAVLCPVEAGTCGEMEKGWMKGNGDEANEWGNG